MLKLLLTQLKRNYQWTTDIGLRHTIAEQVLTNMEGDIRVKDDTIIVTFYRDREELNLKNNFENMPQRLLSEVWIPKYLALLILSWILNLNELTKINCNNKKSLMFQGKPDVL